MVNQSLLEAVSENGYRPSDHHLSKENVYRSVNPEDPTSYKLQEFRMYDSEGRIAMKGYCNPDGSIYAQAFRKYDENGNFIVQYTGDESSDSAVNKCYVDEKGRLDHSESSLGYTCVYAYDDDDHRIYQKTTDSNGTLIRETKVLYENDLPKEDTTRFYQEDGSFGSCQKRVWIYDEEGQILTTRLSYLDEKSQEIDFEEVRYIYTRDVSGKIVNCDSTVYFGSYNSFEKTVTTYEYEGDLLIGESAVRTLGETETIVQYVCAYTYDEQNRLIRSSQRLNWAGGGRETCIENHEYRNNE